MSSAALVRNAAASVDAPSDASGFPIPSLPGAVPVTSGWRSWRRWVTLAELVGLFFVVPLLLATGVLPLKLRLVMLAGGFVVAVFIARRGGAARRDVGLSPEIGGAFRRCLWGGVMAWAAALLITFGVHAAAGEPVFWLPVEQPGAFAQIALVYTFSVLFQEFLFRGYFFWRFAGLLPTAWLAAVNTAAFAWVHIIYGSWVSVALCVPGGVLFAVLYLRERSLTGIAAVHLLMGLSIFALGYGRFFLPGHPDWSAAGQ